MRLRRTTLLGAGALLLSGMTVGLAAPTAFAKVVVPPDAATTCAISGTVSFASPGLSNQGTNTTTLKKTTTSASASLSGCSGGLSGSGTINGGNSLGITSKSSKCTGAGTSSDGNNPPGCPAPVKHTPKVYNYDSAAAFQNSGSASLSKAIKKLSFAIGSTSFQEKVTSATEVLPGGACGGEVGFAIVGTVKKPKQDKNQTVTANVCLGNDGGTNTSGSFFLDVSSAFGGNTSITIATADIDPATSTLSTSG